MSGFSPSVSVLPYGQGLRLLQGPIDLVVRCEGGQSAVQSAYSLAQQAFTPVLQTLVNELPQLRTELPVAITHVKRPVNGPVAKRMWAACQPFTHYRVSLMSAVAGSVADHMLQAVSGVPGIRKAWVNNGGDIAIYLTPGQVFDCGILPDVVSNQLNASFRLHGNDGIGGVATSGRATYGQGGRSFSLGIADSVTVLATDAAAADVAATLVANAVDLPGHTAVQRVPAASIDCDNDLGDRLVVTALGRLSRKETNTALGNGLALAQQFRAQGLIHNAVLTLQGEVRVLHSDSSALSLEELA